jgi:redox-sensitive bicupin YhaK (pirin superfamily)
MTIGHLKHTGNNMSPISRPIDGNRHGNRDLSTVRFDLGRLDDGRSPILLLDDFRVSGRPFGPHPHAGFSAITYVFEDSEGALRSRDSFGADVTVGGGGMVWLQAGRGALHEETPADMRRELHGVQVYVNLTAANKTIAPKTLWVEGADVPIWHDGTGNRVRVLVGAYDGVLSPLVPEEPFRFLDVTVAGRLAVDFDPAAFSLVYARDAATLNADGRNVSLQAGQVVSVEDTASLLVSAAPSARLLVLSGNRIDEPRHIEGPFILNSARDVDSAMARYRSGEMGRLAPRS